jgi:DNA-binding XRE family transcriptional regulator
MASNLKVLRNKLGLTQEQIAEKIGVSRQTLANIENKKIEMSWNTFLALITVFRVEQSTSGLLEYFGIYTPELSEYLVTPKS